MSKLKIVCLADTHTEHKIIKVPPGDVLIFAGDAEFRTILDVVNFNQWLGTLPHQYKIAIGGNHDFFAERNYATTKSTLTNAIYLENEEYILPNGMKLWASPYTKRFYDWAFMLDDDKIGELWAKIPDDTDILVTHGPAYGINDIGIFKYGHVGDKALAERIKQIHPKYHICGHIHRGYGITKLNKTSYINCSVMDEDYQVVNKPTVFTIFRKT